MMTEMTHKDHALLSPAPNCQLCPRLAGFRADNQIKFPIFHNAPVPSFGPLQASLLIVGLAPGLKGANRTGRPFTGDYAGDLLYSTLLKYRFAKGTFEARPDDGLQLIGCRIINAVRCVPPENKPLPLEVASCNPFLQSELQEVAGLKAILALGSIAHGAVLKAVGEKAARYKFAHAARFTLPSSVILFDSYHCSRLNTNTGRLTEAMFHRLFDDIRQVCR